MQNYINTMMKTIPDNPASMDAFGRLKVSQPKTLRSNSLNTQAGYDLFWSTLINGGATGVYNQMTASFDMGVSNNGDYIVSQTKQRFAYQPTKGQQAMMTGIYPSVPGVIQRAGYFDHDNIGLATITIAPQNGVFFKNDGGNLSFNIANNGAITSIPRSARNYDKLDGVGDSHFVLNEGETNIFWVDMERLGVGGVRFGFVAPD